MSYLWQLNKPWIVLHLFLDLRCNNIFLSYWIFWRYLSRYYSMLLIWCCYLVSKYNTFNRIYSLFTKREQWHIISALKKSCFLRSTLLLNFWFDVLKTGKKYKKIFWWYLNRYYSMILIHYYYLVSIVYPIKGIKGITAKKLFFKNGA